MRVNYAHQLTIFFECIVSAILTFPALTDLISDPFKTKPASKHTDKPQD